ncbi:MAG: hypothetical protein Q9M28_03690 [Mariprofundaceae bacterium]|nr:hypothetical protein [Mariprofundaceae bacterium]
MIKYTLNLKHLAAVYSGQLFIHALPLLSDAVHCSIGQRSNQDKVND